MRITALAGTALAFGFTIHALSSPPSNAGKIFNPSLSVPDYYANNASAGVGETVALLALAAAGIGLCVTFTAD
jgi:hypothetical protein